MIGDKNRIIFVILGSTAKALIYDLHKSGSGVGDSGQCLKDYDDYKKKISKTDEVIGKNFKPN